MSHATRRKFTLPKSERLCGRATFDYLFKHASTVRVGVLKCYYAFDLPPSLSAEKMEVGISVPKKFHKRAHDRNRHKRLIREAFRLHKEVILTPLQQSEHSLVLLFVLQSPKAQQYETLTLAVTQILSRLAHAIPPPESAVDSPS